MQANEGLLPTSRMLKFLSHKRLGPSPTGVTSMFEGKYANFQRAVIKEYEIYRNEKDNETRFKLSDLTKQIIEGKTPLNLLQATQDPEESDSIIDEDLIKELISKIGVPEAISRYAKYSVLQYIVSDMSEPVKAKISRGEGEAKGFIRAIRKHHDISGGEIEHAALILQVFDDIWPADEHLGQLKLGNEYDKFQIKGSGFKSVKPHLRVRIGTTN